MLTARNGALLDMNPTDTVRDLRDRALIATLTKSFARIGAALKMKVEDLHSSAMSLSVSSMRVANSLCFLSRWVHLGTSAATK